MNKAILFNFLVDKEKKQIRVERSFDAPLPLVWQAWTDAEILDQWWAPAPWRNKTKMMDFREGGRWLYSMTSPDGNQTHWALMNYQAIADQESFTSEDAFCDENGDINRAFPSNQWNTQFSGRENGTMVNVTLSFDKLEDLEQLVQMGFREGFTQGLEQLDAWLTKKTKSHGNLS